MTPWPIGISTGIAYRHPIDTVLEPIRDADLLAVEVSTAPRHLPLDDDSALERLKRRLTSLGLRTHSLHAPFGHDVNITSPDPTERRHAFERLARAADALKILGGGLYVIHPGGEDQRWVWEREARLALSVEGLTWTSRLCAERGLRLVVETPLPHLLGGQLDDFAWILDRLPPDTAVCVDTSHCALGGFLFDAIDRFAARLAHVQASDNGGSTDDHLPTGEGVIDWERVVQALRRADYRGVFMLEVSGRSEDVRGNVREAADRGRQILGA